MSGIVNVEDNIIPREADIEALIKEGCFEGLRDLLRDQGVYVSCKREELPRLVARYRFLEEFYKGAFGQVHRKQHGIALTGLRFNREGLDGLYEVISAQRDKKIVRSSYRPKIVAVSQGDHGSLNVSIQYEKLNSKFVTRLRTEFINIEAVIEKLPDNSFEFRSNQYLNTDSIVLRDVAEAILQEAKAQIVESNLTLLPVANRVNLFDQVVKDDAKKTWRIEETCGFTIKREDSDKEELLSKDHSSILKKAILDGSNLRDHSIVKDLVKQNYFFSSVTFFASHQKDPSIHFKVKVDFKQNPVVLVVSAEQARVFDAEGRFTTRSVGKEEGQKCIEYFWSYIHVVLNQEKQAALKHAKSVARVAA